jgi:hypothetical protein
MNEPQSSQQGGCICGRVRYEVAGAPVLTYKCHCLACQRHSGGLVAVAWAWFRRDGFRLLQGEPHFIKSIADSGRTIARGRCPDCGAALMARLMARVIAITVPGLDDASWYQPECEIWVSKARPRDALLPQTRKFDEGFDMTFIRQRLGM